MQLKELGLGLLCGLSYLISALSLLTCHEEIMMALTPLHFVRLK